MKYPVLIITSKTSGSYEGGVAVHSLVHEFNSEEEIRGFQEKLKAASFAGPVPVSITYIPLY